MPFDSTAEIDMKSITGRSARYCCLIVVAACLFVARPSMAAEGINGSLVNTQWLAKNLDRGDIVVLDASSQARGLGLPIIGV